MDVSKHGIMKFREERSILGLGLPSGHFHERFFILNVTSLRMYKDVRVRVLHTGEVFIVLSCYFISQAYEGFCFFCQSNRPEREWPVKSLKVYLGIKKKLRPPTL